MFKNNEKKMEKTKEQLELMIYENCINNTMETFILNERI